MSKRRLPAILALVAAACLGGCAGGLTPQAQQLLQKSYDAYEAGEDRAALASLDSFLADNARSGRADEAYYLRGLAKWRLKDEAGAEADLTAAVESTGHAELRGKAFIALGELAYARDDMAAAENMFRQALAEIDEGVPPADAARLRLGLAMQRQGRWEDADVQFDRLIQLFSDSDRAKLAARRAHCAAWTVVAFGFDETKRARLEAARLTARGMAAEIRPVVQDGRPLFLVQIGRYPAYAEAAAVLPKVQALYPEAVLLPTP